MAVIVAALAGPRLALGQETVPDSLASILEEAQAALATGDDELAIRRFRQAQGFIGRRLIYGNGEQFYYAEAAEIHMGLAEIYLRLDDAYAAAVEANRGVNLAQNDVRLWTLLGLASYRLADIEHASKALERAVELDPSDPEILWGLGLVAIARNRPGEARDFARRAMDISPQPQYALALAQWAVLEDDYEGAARALGSYLTLAPDDPDAESYRNLMRFYDLVRREPTNRLDERVTRAQLNFELKTGDEIPYVEVSFNGQPPAYILLDTGAARNVIDREYARAIGIEPIHPGGKLHGVYRQSPGGYALVDSLNLGSISVHRIPFAVGDFKDLDLREQDEFYIAGVVNPAILFRDFLVVLDYGHQRIELLRYGAGGENYVDKQTRLRKIATSFHFDANGVWPVFLVSLDGSRSLPFLADTGASDLLIARRTAGVILLNPQSFAASAGGYTKERLRGILLDGTPAEPWGIGLHGILGFPFFRGMRIVFDYENTMLIIEN